MITHVRQLLGAQQLLLRRGCCALCRQAAQSLPHHAITIADSLLSHGLLTVQWLKQHQHAVACSQ